MTVRFGACVLDPETRELRRGGQLAHLSPKAFDLLLALLANRPRAVTKEELRIRLWPATFVHEANLPNLVAEVRAALGDDARRPRFVRTVARVGYAFAGPVVEGEAAPAGSEPERPFVYRLVGVKGAAVLLEGDHLIGRHPDSVIELQATGVSRRHARLRVRQGQAILEDLGSRNGTFVRGERLSGPAVLADGDEFRLGSVVLTFRVFRALGFGETT